MKLTKLLSLTCLLLAEVCNGQSPVIRSPWTTNVVPSNATATNVTIIGVRSNSFRLTPTSAAAGVIYNPTNDTLSVSGNILFTNNPSPPTKADLGFAGDITSGFAGTSSGSLIDVLFSGMIRSRIAGDFWEYDSGVSLIWNSAGSFAGAFDLGVSRASPGVLQIGNSTSFTHNGSLLASNAWFSGTFAVTNSISNLPTNQAPTSVTIGVTVPDGWVWFTNSGTAFAIPAWKNH